MTRVYIYGSTHVSMDVEERKKRKKNNILKKI